MTLQPDSTHRRHDPLLVAAHAAGDLTGPEAAAATAQIADCTDCATLDADLRALATAVHTLPAVARVPRDFRLTAEQVAQLRGGPWWRRIIRSVVAPRGFGRPLATGLTTLGLVGILLGSVPAGALPAMLTTTGDRSLGYESTSNAPTVAPEAIQPTDATGAYLRDAQRTGGRGNAEIGSPVGAGAGTPTPVPTDAPKDNFATGGGTESTVEERWDQRAVSPLLILSIVFLAVGLGLFALPRLARRLA
jgi:hypothetical protein